MSDAAPADLPPRSYPDGVEVFELDPSLAVGEADARRLDSSVDADDEGVEIDQPDLTLDRVFQLRIAQLLEVFTIRQGEILRLAQYMDERAAEIDNATERAKSLIEKQINDTPSEDAINKLIAIFAAVEADDLGDDTLSAQERRDAIVNGLREVSEELPPGLDGTYIDAVLRATQAPPGAEMLRASLLVSLVGELETMIGHLARACFERQPSALDDGGRTFTWAEIAKYESLDDMRDAVVDRAIEDVMRGSLTEWVDYFVKRFKISPIAAAARYEPQEAIQRRHCIVHNSGLVSPTYLDRLSSFAPPQRVDEELTVDSDYLRQAADALFLVAFSLVWALGFKMCGEPDVREDLATSFANRTYYLLQDQRYALVRLIGKDAPLDRIDESAGFVIKVNYWLAHKLDGQFDSVRGEVEGLDVRAKARRFNLAKHALLDEHEDAHRLAQTMIRDGELRPEFLFTWPLLAGVREYMRNNPDDREVDSAGLAS